VRFTNPHHSRYAGTIVEFNPHRGENIWLKHRIDMKKTVAPALLPDGILER
jgi:hypothetical protein